MLIAPAPALRAATHRRVSRQQRADAFSLGAQGKDCRKLADESSAEVVATFEDIDSGADWDLPGLDAMLDAAKRGELDVLVCYDPDRLARNMAKQLVVEEELGRFGVTIRYVTLPTSGSAEDNLLKNVRSSIAEYEREKRLVKLTIDRLDAEGGSPAEAALRAAADQTDQQIKTLKAEADDLRSRPTPVIGAAEADAIEAFAAEERECAEYVTEGDGAGSTSC